MINENGKKLRNFVTLNKLKVTNTFYRRKYINKYARTARGQRSLVNYIIIKKN